MRAYSMDLRMRVLAALDGGSPTAVVAARFAVSRSWVRRLAQRRRENQEVAPRTRTPRVSRLVEHHPRIRELLTAAPDRTLAELRADLGVAVALSTLWTAVRSLGLTFKKR
jgi:transposase